MAVFAVASGLMSLPAAGAPELFNQEKACLFDVPLESGAVLRADARPTHAFGKLLAKRHGETRLLSAEEFATIDDERERVWDACAAWRALDSRPLQGLRLPGWEDLAPPAWRTKTDFVFVYVLRGWCEPCLVSLKRLRELTSVGAGARLKILVIAMGEGDPIWARAFARHGLQAGPRWHITYLAHEAFTKLSKWLQQGDVVGLALITDQTGCILHSDVGPLIATDVTRRVLESAERCGGRATERAPSVDSPSN